MTASHGRFRFVRRWSAGLLLGGSLAASQGCSLVPTREEIRSTTTAVKDQVTGKARKDRLTKTYAEARIFERRKEYAAAEQLYRELLKEEPRSRDCYHRLGVMAAVQGKYAEAHQHYQTALSCNSPTPDLLSDIGFCHYLQQQLPEAEQVLRRALVIDPKHRNSLNNLAMVAVEMGRTEEAYELFGQAATEPGQADANFAFMCAQCGDLGSAQEHFSRALSANPELRAAIEGLLQVTQKMQAMNDAAARMGMLDAEGKPLAPPTHDPNVQSVGYKQPSSVPPQKLIEVYSGGPMSRETIARIAAQANMTPPAANNLAPAASAGGVIQASYNAPAANVAPHVVAPTSNAVPNVYVPNVATPTGIVPQVPTPQTVHPQTPTPGTVQPLTAPSPFTYPQMPQPGYLQPQSTPPSNYGGMPGGASGPSAPAGNAMPAGGPPLSFPPLSGIGSPQ